MYSWSAPLDVLQTDFKYIWVTYYTTAWTVSSGKQVLWEYLNWEDSYCKAQQKFIALHRWNRFFWKKVHDYTQQGKKILNYQDVMESCCRVPYKCLGGKKRFFKRVDENWAWWPVMLKSFPHYPSPAGQFRKLVWLFLGGQWMGTNCNDVLCCQNLTQICRLRSVSSDSPKQLKIMWSFPANHPTMNRSKCWDFFICFLFRF